MLRVLFLTQRLPYAPNRGDRVRAYHLLRLMRTFSTVDLISFVHDDEELGHAASMTGNGEVWPVPVTKARNHVKAVPALLGSTPLTHLLLDSPRMHAVLVKAAARHPDVVVAFGSGMARFCVAEPLKHVPLVLDMVDADSAKWASLAETAPFPMSWVYRRETRCLGAFERAVTATATATTVVNERERDVLRAIAPEGDILVVPNGVDVTTLRPQTPPADSEDVVFCGVMNYTPNEEGAVWLAREVWPTVRRARPSARLVLVGSSPTNRVLELADAAQGIIVTGSVPDVKPHLWAAAVSAAPLLTARGIQNKVLEAVAAGLPAVVTSPVYEGLPEEVRPACTLAPDAPTFAAALIGALRLTPGERRARAEAAHLTPLSWETSLAPFKPLLERARPATS